MIQTAEGALNQDHDMLQRMRELAIQASNDTLSALDRAAINAEVQQLRDEINVISTRTTFNRKHLLQGNLEVTQDTSVVGSLLTGTTHGDSVGSDALLTTIDVENAETAMTYTLDGSVANELTLSADLNNDGDTTDPGESQTLMNATGGGSLPDSIVDNEELVINFDTLGVRLRIVGQDASENTADIFTSLNGGIIATNADNATANFQIGPGTDQFFAVDFVQVDGDSLDLTTALDDYDVDQSLSNAIGLIGAVDDAINEVSQIRARLGAAQNRLQYTIGNLQIGFENLSASDSRIRDADMPVESVAFNRALILRQTGTAVLAQANAGPQSVLQLLQ
jgi:flagellin